MVSRINRTSSSENAIAVVGRGRIVLQVKASSAGVHVRLVYPLVFAMLGVKGPLLETLKPQSEPRPEFLVKVAGRVRCDCII